MPEGLSPEQNKEARDFVINERYRSDATLKAARELRGLTANKEMVEKAHRHAEFTQPKDPRLVKDLGDQAMAFGFAANQKQHEVETLSDQRDAILWKSQQHYKDNKEAYIETAKQEATDRGIDIQGPALSDNPDHPE